MNPQTATSTTTTIEASPLRGQVSPKPKLSRRQILAGLAVLAVTGVFVVGSQRLLDGDEAVRSQKPSRVAMSKVLSATAFVWETQRSAPGKPQQHVWVFANPACVHCMKLEETLRVTSDLIIHTVLIPNEKGIEAARQVWCSGDPAASWAAHVAGQPLSNEPPPSEACDVPFKENQGIADDLQLEYTPAVVNERGVLRYGAMDAVTLLRHLAE